MKKILFGFLVLICVFGLVGCGKKEETTKEEAKVEEKETVKPGCNGPMNAVYEGEYNETQGMFTINEFVTVTLRDDGTFSAVYKDSEGYDGTYTLEESVLKTKFIGSQGEMTLTYQVKDDCSSILWGEADNYQYTITKK